MAWVVLKDLMSLIPRIINFEYKIAMTLSYYDYTWWYTIFPDVMRFRISPAPVYDGGRTWLPCGRSWRILSAAWIGENGRLVFDDVSAASDPFKQYGRFTQIRMNLTIDSQTNLTSKTFWYMFFGGKTPRSEIQDLSRIPTESLTLETDGFTDSPMIHPWIDEKVCLNFWGKSCAMNRLHRPWGFWWDTWSFGVWGLNQTSGMLYQVGLK